MNSAEGPWDGKLDVLGGSIDFAGLRRLVVSHWIQLLAFCMIGGVVGLSLSFAFDRVYEANAVLVEANSSLGAAEGGGLGATAGLAALVGVPTRSGGRLEEAIATLQSRALIEEYIDSNHLLPILFASRWDGRHSAWRHSWISSPPTAWDGYLRLKGLLDVSENSRTGLISVSLKWTDAELAQVWLSGLIGMTNARLRAASIERSEGNIAFLKSKAQDTRAVELRSAFFNLIESEVKNEMVAQGSANYAFRYVDPPATPVRPVFPNRAVFLLLGAVCGVLVGCVWLSLRLKPRADARAKPVAQ